MRRRHLLVAAAVLAVVAFGHVPATSAGEGGPQVEIVKATEGPVPEDAVFVIELSCEESGDVEVELGDGESAFEPFLFGEECTVTEIDDQGAESVAYECEDIEGVDCIDDQTFVSQLNGVREPEVRVTVTNTFAEPTTTTTIPTTTTAAPAAAPVAVVATPAFTG
jgi:hypothetical protein